MSQSVNQSHEVSSPCDFSDFIFQKVGRSFRYFVSFSKAVNQAVYKRQDKKDRPTFFIEILKKALFFDTINLETAKMLLLYLTYKELRLVDQVFDLDLVDLYVIPYL